MTFLKHLFYTIILISISGSVYSQDESIPKRNFIIEPRIHYGNVLPFYDAIKYLVQDHAKGFDLRIGFPTYGDDYWEKIYRYPRTGTGYSCWSFGNSDVFGYAHALYGFFDASLFQLHDIYSLSYQISFGASYLPKIFDVSQNHLNRAIGSHVNVYFRIGFDSRIKISDRTELSLESGFSHFSNGKFRSPNYGLNAFTGSVGLNYLFGNAGNHRITPQLPVLSRRFTQSVMYSAGVKVYDNLIGTRYFLSSFSYNLDWLWRIKRKLGIGIDLFYDASIAEALAVDGKNNKNEANFFRLGIHGSHTIQYKKLFMGMDLGHYLYSRYTDLTLIYSRLAIQYLVTEHLLLNVSLKSHLAKADFIEWGIGYHW